MARGWESKSVEEQQQMTQQAQAEAQTQTVSKDDLNRLKAEKARKIQALKLTHARVREQLERCTSARYADMLNLELQHIDEELKSLQ